MFTRLHCIPDTYDTMARLVLFNKPYDVLSQFTDQEARSTLKTYIDIEEVYAAGRLDRDSEGLLLLTDDGRLQQQLSDPRFKAAKTYLVQVEGEISPEALATLAQGVALKDGPTLPAVAKKIEDPQLWDRIPPIRVRKTVPDSWLELTIREGRNRQVRRMTAAVGFPTLRLIRTSIGPWSLDGLKPGQYRLVEVDSPPPTHRGSGPSAKRGPTKTQRNKRITRKSEKGQTAKGGSQKRR